MIVSFTGRRVAGPFPAGGHHQEGVGEHDQGLPGRGGQRELPDCDANHDRAGRLPGQLPALHPAATDDGKHDAAACRRAIFRVN
jgi:hypothetical protein